MKFPTSTINTIVGCRHTYKCMGIVGGKKYWSLVTMPWFLKNKTTLRLFISIPYIISWVSYSDLTRRYGLTVSKQRSDLTSGRSKARKYGGERVPWKPKSGPKVFPAAVQKWPAPFKAETKQDNWRRHHCSCAQNK